MIIHLEGVVDSATCKRLAESLARASFVDGGATAGRVDQEVKKNLQLPGRDPMAREIAKAIMEPLVVHPGFSSSVRMLRMLPPRINRYDTGMYYREHLDNTIMRGPQGAGVRADLAMTLCINDSADYEGGELVIHTDTGERRFRGAAGDAIIYPAGYIHEVTEVTAGQRLVAVSWIQSQVRDAEQRRVLCDLENTIRFLDDSGVDREKVLPLRRSLATLVRRWSEL